MSSREQTGEHSRHPKLFSARHVSPLLLAAILGAVGAYGADPEYKPPVAAAPTFGIGSVGAIARPELIDLDGDGDLDLLSPALGSALTPTGVAFFRNTGSAGAPTFAGGNSLSPFGLDYTVYIASLCFGDLNGDGDFDLVITKGGTSGTRPIYVCMNTGSATNPAFAPKQTAPFGLTGNAMNIASPNLADIDGDSDLDMFLGIGSPAGVEFRRNTGNSTSPAFAAPSTNPFGIVVVPGPSNNYWQPEVVDIDGDSDKDLIVGNQAGSMLLYRNTGNSTNPAFAAAVTNPFSFTAVSGVVSFSIRDFDADGDLDALAGRGSAFHYYKNSPVPKLPLGVVLLQPSTTDQEMLEFSMTFSEPVTTTFTTADFSLTGSLAAGATVFQDPTLADPNYAFLVSLANPNADGTLGLTITGTVSDSQGEVMVVPVNSPLYTIANYEGGDVNKDDTFDVADVALLADANLGLATLP